METLVSLRKEYIMNIIQKRRKKVFALLTAATLCFSSPFTYVLHAENTTQKQQDLENNLNELNKDKDATGKNLSAATSSLSKTMKEISTTQQELALAKVRENGQYELMKKRIKYIYESGSASLLSMLFESESMADLLNKAEFISTVSEYDRTMLEKLQTLHSSIAKKEKELRQQQKNFEKQKKDLEEKGAKNVVLTDLSRDDMSKALADAFRFTKLVVACATYDGGLFPCMEDFLHHLKAKNYQKRTVALIENGSWAPMAAKQMKAFFETLKNISICENVITVKSTVKPETEVALASLADTLLKSNFYFYKNAS